MSGPLKYKLENLEWQQFELLSLKCLQFDISPSLHFLEGGHDKGRDFIFEGITNYFGKGGDEKNSYIFQAKHKSKLSDFSSLKQDLNKELRKVYLQHSLTYPRYCLVTNLAISANQYDELISEVNEFKKKQGLTFPTKLDIYSYRHFETCLDKNKSLRISFPSILQVGDFKTLLEEIVSRSEQNLITSWLRVFEKNAGKFVYTKIFENALHALDKANAVLLSGPPKSGKTFTAEMLAFNKFLAHEFFPYHIANIDAFYDYFDPEKKQFFLFDDSIGKHNIEIYRADSINRSLHSILQLLDENHKLVFTSREYIIKDYKLYAESDFFLNNVTKINASTTDWSPAEKESLLRRYFKLTFNNEISDYIIIQIINHRNFEPETIRAFFENHSNHFDPTLLIKHLEKPDLYLKSFFDNISEDKKIVLLSILFSVAGSEKDIGYTFENILEDLKIHRIINLKLQLEVLQDSVIAYSNGVYRFLHPSMLDFFMELISSDGSTYRKLMFKNINLVLLAATSIRTKRLKHEIVIEESDLDNLSTGFERILKAPTTTLFEINSIFAWLGNPDFKLRKKTERTQAYANLKSKFLNALGTIDYASITKNSNIFHAIDFIKNVSIEGKKNTLSDIHVERILLRFNHDPNYWQLALRVSSFLTEKQIKDLIGKTWFSDFHNNLKESIDILGNQLFGDAYPEFTELKQYREAAKNNSEIAHKTFEKQQTSFYMKRTDVDWYPNYVSTKQKMAVLKSSHPHGYKVYSTLIERFEIIKRLEEHQKSRHNYKLRHKAWDMINGLQPKFTDPDDYERWEESYWDDSDDRRRDEEE